MQQIKIFTGIEGETGQLETEVNQWLRETSVRVVQVIGNMSPQAVLPSGDGGGRLSSGSSAGSRRFAPSDVMIIVVYEAE